MKSEWIGIKERMPEIGQKILGYTSFNMGGHFFYAQKRDVKGC